MRYRAAAVVLALAAAVAIGQVPMYSDYPWGLVNNGVDQGPVYNLDCRPPLVCTSPSYGNGRIQLGDGGVLDVVARYALDAGISNNVVCTRCIIGDRLGLGAVGSLELGDLAVTTDKLNNLAVTEGKLGALAVTEGKLGALAVTEGKLGAAAVTNAKLADLSISSVKLQDSAVIEAKLGTGAVTNAKLGALAVDSAKLAAGAVTTAKIASGAVTTAELGTGAVTSAKLGAGAVDNAALGDLSISAGKLQDGAVSNAKLGALAVDAAKLATGAVTTAKLASGAVDAAALGTGAVTSTKLAAGAVDATALGAGAVTTAKLAAGAVDTTALGASAVTSTKLAAGAVDTTALGASAVTSAKLASGAVGSTALATGAVTSLKLAAGAVDSAALGTNAVTTTAISSLAVTASKLDDGIALSAYDEEGPAAISARASATNASEGTYSGEGYVRFTTTGTGVNLTSQVTTGLYTGTSTDLLTTRAVVRYRISGGWTAGGNVTMTAVNTANTAQTAAFTISTDGNWHTAVADISGWTTAGTLRIDVNGKPNGASYNDLSYIATGNPGSGTGALVSYRGNVGVGTASPPSKFSVAGSQGNTNGLSVTSSDVATVVTHDAATNGGKIQVKSGGSSTSIGTSNYRLLLQPEGGDVGINTTAPTFPLDVSGAIRALGLIIDYYGTYGLNLYYAGGWRYAGNGYGSVWAAGGSGSLDLYTAGNNTVGAGAAASLSGPHLSITNGGNVGIGTTSPGTRLSVAPLVSAGAPSPGTASGGFSLLGNNNLYGLYAGVDSSGAAWWQAMRNDGTATAYPLWLNPSGGNVGIGTTDPGSALGVKGDVALRTANSRTTSYRVARTDTGATNPMAAMRMFGGGTNGYLGNIRFCTIDADVFNDTCDDRVTIDSDGDVGIGITAPVERLHVSGGNIRNSALSGTGNRAVYSDASGTLTNSSSDATLKTNVQDLVSPLRMVLGLRPVSFSWKNVERFGSQREIGFLAQEVMQSIPEVVGKNADGTYTVDYPKIVAALAGAVQELYEDRTALAQRVQALEDRAQQAEDKLAQLEARLAALEAR